MGEAFSKHGGGKLCLSIFFLKTLIEGMNCKFGIYERIILKEIKSEGVERIKLVTKLQNFISVILGLI